MSAKPALAAAAWHASFGKNNMVWQDNLIDGILFIDHLCVGGKK